MEDKHAIDLTTAFLRIGASIVLAAMTAVSLSASLRMLEAIAPIAWVEGNTF